MRELVDGNHVDKYGTGGDTRLLTADGTTTNNGTKSNPALSGDLFGDWREEVIWRTTNNSALRIYTTTNVATNRIYTLLHDPQYRVAIAWQNTAYNQPPHPGFFIGANMPTPPTPNIVIVGGTPPDPQPGTPTYQAGDGIVGWWHGEREHQWRIHRQRLRELLRHGRLRAGEQCRRARRRQPCASASVMRWARPPAAPDACW